MYRSSQGGSKQIYASNESDSLFLSLSPFRLPSFFISLFLSPYSFRPILILVRRRAPRISAIKVALKGRGTVRRVIWNIPRSAKVHFDGQQLAWHDDVLIEKTCSDATSCIQNVSPRCFLRTRQAFSPLVWRPCGYPQTRRSVNQSRPSTCRPLPVCEL